MRQIIFSVLLICSISFSQTTKPLIMVHFMPWHQTPSIHGYWGWHWTMNHYNPDIIDANGQREIASHFYPLTGPYDSDDKLILEYQTLLMKISGIDGALVDWDGMENYLDYGTNNISTQNTFTAIQKANLYFGIVYEDYTIKTMINNGHMTADTALKYGKSVMKYLQNNWFNTSTYVKIAAQPVLLNFGPQYFTQSANWDTLFSGLTVKPIFFNEDNRLAPAATGAFCWPPMSLKDGSGVLQQSALNNYLNQYYLKAASWSHVVTSAFPGFHDIYAEAGVQPSWGYLDPLNGFTFKSTLYQAVVHNPDIIQIVTWNDYGEGTIVEPTVEFGYQYLEVIQATKDTLNPNFPFQKSDLQMPLQIYNARLKYAGNASANSVLDRVYNFIIAGQRDAAIALLDSLLNPTSVKTINDNTPNRYYLSQNYPNPFNPQTLIGYTLQVASKTTLKVYDILGREVATLVNEEQKTGEYKIIFNANNLPSGVYFYQLYAGNFIDTKKMLLMK